MCCRKFFNLISFGCMVLDSCLCKTRYSHLSVYLWVIFLLNQTSSVGNIISFREAMIYVVILMLKSSLFYFLLLYLCGQQEDNIFQCLLLPVPFRTKHRHQQCSHSLYSRRQKSVLHNNFKEGKLQGNLRLDSCHHVQATQKLRTDSSEKCLLEYLSAPISQSLHPVSFEKRRDWYLHSKPSLAVSCQDAQKWDFRNGNQTVFLAIRSVCPKSRKFKCGQKLTMIHSVQPALVPHVLTRSCNV